MTKKSDASLPFADPNRNKSGLFGAGNTGKPKGALSKTTRSAKDAIALAAEQLGGAERIVAWCNEDPQNERVFWGTMYPKLLPLQLTGDGGGPIMIGRVELVALA
jgi:acyl-coenzyme A synthetase/AMP-(fatty) acid ligase